MSFISPEERREIDTMPLYSTNLEPSDGTNFIPNSPLNYNSDTDTQNYQAVRASELRDHLRQIITQKQGPYAIDDISEFSDSDNENNVTKEIETRSEKGSDSMTEPPQCFIGADYDSSKLITVIKKPEEKAPTRFEAQNESILEQDGIYVSKQPKMKNGNKDRITARLELNPEDRKQYFDDEDNLRNNAPNIRQIPPPFKEEPILPPYYNSEKSQTLPATVWGLENSTTARNIRIEVNQVRFTVHHLSSEEDILSKRLDQIYTQYLHAIQYPRENYYATRVKALRRELKSSPETSRLQILEEINNNHKMQDTEEVATRMKLEQLLVTWHELKDLRSKNHYNLTTNALRWQSKKFTPEATQQEQLQFDKAVEKRAREVVELASLKNETLDLEETIQQIKQYRTDKGLRNPGDPLWRPVLYTIERSPDSSITSADASRLENLDKVRISCAFMMGTTELRSREVKLDDNFIADIDTGCLASTMRVPNDVRIHIFESGDQKSAEIATVPMPVINGIPEDFIDYEFSAESKAKNGLIIQGYLNGRAFVVTDTDTAQTILPNSKRINDLKPEVQNRFLSIPKYLEVVAKHDPNDPYIVRAIGSVLAESGEQRIHNRFAVDVEKEATKFESMAPSNLCEVIHQKAYDKLYGDFDKQQSQKPKLQLGDVVRDCPDPTAKNFFQSFWHFITFRRGKGITVDKKAPSCHLQDFSFVSLKITEFSGLPSEASGVIARIHFLNEIVESGIYDPINNIFRQETSYTPTSTLLATTESLTKTNGTKKKNSNGSEPAVKGFSHKFKLTRKGSVPHFTEIEDERLRIDLFDSVQENFISTISIPLRSLFVNGTISGNYSLFTAPFSLAFSSITNDTNNTIDSSRSRTMRINMSMSLNPSLIPPKYADIDPCGEKPEVKRRALKVLQYFDNLNMNRRIVPLATTQPTPTTPSKQLLPCRYIIPQTIPRHLEQTIPSLLSFVSIIPTTPDSLMPGTFGNRWSTSQEVINRSCGTTTEHAILLCNFLKYIEVDSYVILGNDALIGLCAFVGVRSTSGEMQILDPTSGREVEISSSKASTLLDIGTVFNDRNIWFNIQKEKMEVSHISWRFTDTNCWIPFFNKGTPREEASSPQENILVFEDSPAEHTERLRETVESVIMGVTEQLRDQLDHKLTTNWDTNDVYTSKLRDILECAAKGETEAVTSEFNKLTYGKTGRKKNVRLVGTPFFVAYVYDEDNVEKLRSEILEEIRYRGEYANTDRGIKFAAAANVTTFPNDIYGIWILLAAIIPIKKSLTDD